MGEGLTDPPGQLKAVSFLTPGTRAPWQGTTLPQRPQEKPSDFVKLWHTLQPSNHLRALWASLGSGSKHLLQGQQFTHWGQEENSPLAA